MLYTPTQQGGAGIDLQLHNWSDAYRHRFTGSYAGLNRQLTPYNLGDLTICYDNIVWQLPTRLSIDIKNLFNTDFQVIEDRPMPGRHYRFTLRFNFTKTRRL
ncbi:MAG: TonB-dependent receptor [Desulfobulbaceae bacterium]|nr:MAG: TonB-dependent receptor [Desulfobulbaceae bacterium]